MIFQHGKMHVCVHEYCSFAIFLDDCYLGHYAQWFFWFFFTIGIFVVAGGIRMMIAQNYGK
ncbi:hypothetical protein [Segatella sp.]|uniref:hypothetical protein n=1 Tax=Segatella sp. TaxID=2974253 RepID=UPI00307DD3CE